MTPLYLLFIGLPLTVITLPALIGTLQEDHDPNVPRRQMFVVLLTAYSMFASAIGMVLGMVVDSCYGLIPGRASDGYHTDGRYYFNWHDETYTEVSQATWERAWFWEHLAGWFFFVSLMILVLSMVTLGVMRKTFTPLANGLK